ncbi:NAD(P)/FAD-dependent oxidoreductase [Thalassorhabdomicrobium marinisediminis]|uniref:Aminoacetone oxidase family FAD-binding enzyme n=1 Tax=Thalassorhabdomicrobium marinisediminis TaxID=2170577 RepID=A0A2T7FXW2_9RHOB|nr:NAD(P)/FAD-dependent oxidoreductase [Thalassorhabdomicrobium marinisediminis]PVA07011.1 aminoacetone oxidase family FAD-binding enzyme [Thalassorhabdomicrobium marinisediminis]
MQVNTLILGAGAAGLHCAAHCGPGTLVLDHAKAAGEKIRISGGGRCNFTNTGTTAANFISSNPHFAKSALARYTQWDFIDLVNRHGIPWHEKTLGQLFCDTSAKDIIAMLLAEMAENAQLWLNTSIGTIRRGDTGFHVATKRQGGVQTITARNLVVATGGKSIPKMGATGLAYQIAEQFGLNVTSTRAGLVPFTFSDEKFKPLAGVATPARVGTQDGTAFDEALLFTHRGLSGPAVLQASSYWREGEEITITLSPDFDLAAALRGHRQTDGRKALSTVLGQYLPARLVDFLAADLELAGNVADASDARIDALVEALSRWRLKPAGTEGYRTAEVTLGGVDTNGLSSKTMEAKSVPGLYFIGEAVDVTGWLGGYNFQWAWSSAHAAGTAIAAGG